MKYYDYPQGGLRGWSTVTLPSFKGQANWDDMFDWCKDYESTSEFCVSMYSDTWWFRKEKDALVFALRWS